MFYPHKLGVYESPSAPHSSEPLSVLFHFSVVVVVVVFYQINNLPFSCVFHFIYSQLFPFNVLTFLYQEHNKDCCCCSLLTFFFFS